MVVLLCLDEPTSWVLEFAPLHPLIPRFARNQGVRGVFYPILSAHLSESMLWATDPFFDVFLLSHIEFFFESLQVLNPFGCIHSLRDPPPTPINQCLPILVLLSQQPLPKGDGRGSSPLKTLAKRGKPPWIALFSHPPTQSRGFSPLTDSRQEG